MQEMVQQYRPKLVEAVAETDEALIEKYWKAKNLQKLKSAKVYGRLPLIVPVLCGSAFKNKGVQLMLDAVVDYLPAPIDVPPIQGTLPSGEVLRHARDEEPFSALALRLWTPTVA